MKNKNEKHTTGVELFGLICLFCGVLGWLCIIISGLGRLFLDITTDLPWLHIIFDIVGYTGALYAGWRIMNDVD